MFSIWPRVEDKNTVVKRILRNHYNPQSITRACIKKGPSIIELKNQNGEITKVKIN
jgi:hypothetical protein